MNGHRHLSDPRRQADEGVQVLRTNYGFIPSKLEVPGRPELVDFPNCIVFQSAVRSEGVVETASAVYEPLVSSYQASSRDPRGASVTYFNICGPERANLTIFVDPEKSLPFQALKRIDDSLVGTVIGEGWKTFFRNLTLLGLTKFEPHRSTNVVD